MKSNGTIIVIEPSDVIRRGLVTLLEQSGSFSRVANSNTLDIDAISNGEFDIVLVNPSLVSSLKQLKNISSNSRIAALIYQHFRQSVLYQYDLIIDITEPEVQIIELLIGLLKSENRELESNSNEELSVREKEILVELATGLTNKEIADKLHISTHTVTTHRKNIIRKTGIRTVAGLTLYAHFNKINIPD